MTLPLSCSPVQDVDCAVQEVFLRRRMLQLHPVMLQLLMLDSDVQVVLPQILPAALSFYDSCRVVLEVEAFPDDWLPRIMRFAFGTFR